MPFYTYRCQDCQAILELLIKNADLEPSRCGLHCTLKVGENDNIRGFGELQRSFRDIGGSGVNSLQSAASSGLSTYKKDCDGNYRKVAGKEGPEILDPKDPRHPSQR